MLRRGSQVHLDDLPARLIYLKDETEGAIWTANVFPGGRCDTFEARHGMGYTTFTSAYRGRQGSFSRKASSITLFLSSETPMAVPSP